MTTNSEKPNIFLAIVGLISCGACLALVLSLLGFFKTTPGQEAYNKCTQGYREQNRLTVEAVRLCKAIGDNIDAGGDR